MSDRANTDFPSSADRAVDSLHPHRRGRSTEAAARTSSTTLILWATRLIKSAVQRWRSLVCRQSIPDDGWDKGHKQTQSAQGTGSRRAAKSLAMESGIRRRFGRTRRSGFAAVGSGAPRRSSTTAIAKPAANPRLDDGFCWLTDDSSLEFRQRNHRSIDRNHQSSTVPPHNIGISL